MMVLSSWSSVPTCLPLQEQKPCHTALQLQGGIRTDPGVPASPSQEDMPAVSSPGPSPTCSRHAGIRNAVLIFCFFFEMGSPHVVGTGLELVGSRDPPASASLAAGTTADAAAPGSPILYRSKHLPSEPPRNSPDSHGNRGHLLLLGGNVMF